MRKYSRTIRREILRDLLHKKKYNQAIYTIKYNIPFNEKKSISSKLNEIAFNVLFSHPTPNRFEILASQKVTTSSSVTLKDELDWTILKILQNASVISNFLKLKLEFEAKYESANLEEAELTLNQIENECGVSLWLIKKRLLLCKSDEILKQNYLKSIDRQDVSVNVKVLASYFSIQIAENLPISSYQSFIKDLKRKYNKYPQLLNILLWFLDPLHPLLNPEDCKNTLTFFSAYSVIDNYLILDRIFPSLIKVNIINDDYIDFMTRECSDFPEFYRWKNIHNTSKIIMLTNDKNGNTFAINGIGLPCIDNFDENYQNLKSTYYEVLKRNSLEDIHIIHRKILACEDHSISKQFSKYFLINFSIDSVENDTILNLLCFENFNNEYKLTNEINQLVFTKKYQIAIETLANSANFSGLNTWVISKKVQCLIGNNDIYNAVKLIVDNTLTRGSLLPCLYSPILHSELTQGKYGINIHIPILLDIFNANSTDIYDAYADFLQSKKVKLPSQLLTMAEGEPDKYLIRFLKNICTIKVLSESIFLKSIEEVESERLKIINLLLKHDKHKNNTELIDEAFGINTQSAIRNAVVKIHDGRIYIATEELSDLLNRELKDSFRRYLSQVDRNFYDYSSANVDSSPSKDVMTFYYKDDPNHINNNYHTKKEILELTSYSRFLNYKEMFNLIKEEYIFNKDFGLKSFLSMRIRHGTFKNQLRRVFESNGIFNANNLTQEAVILNSLEKLGEEIDQINSNALNRINIKEREDDLALFEYSFTDNDLLIAYHFPIGREIELDKFVFQCIKLLDQRTELNNEKIKAYLSNDLLEQFCSKIDETLAEIRRIDFSERGVIEDCLIKCKTDIQTTMSNVMKWFNICSTDTVNTHDLSTIVNASLKFQESINSVQLEMISDIPEQLVVKGDYFYPMADLFNLIIDNIVKHSVNSKFNLQVIINNNHLEIKTSNKIDKNTSEFKKEDIIKNINSICRGAENSFEGKSGYPKMHRVISEDLKQQNYEIIPTFNSDNFDIRVKLFNMGIFSE